jgi:hypothetical protein
MASDGRWYPPHLHPQAAALWYPQPSTAAWQQPRRRGRGCLYSVLAVLVLVVLIVIIAAIVAASKVKTTPGSGTLRHPAAADVSVTSCGVDPTLKYPLAKGTVLNHSSGKSNYTFTISFLNRVGVVVGQGIGAEGDIAAGQTATFTTYGDSAVSGPVTCKIVNVTRFASP